MPARANLSNGDVRAESRMFKDRVALKALKCDRKLGEALIRCSRPLTIQRRQFFWKLKRTLASFIRGHSAFRRDEAPIGIFQVI